MVACKFVQDGYLPKGTFAYLQILNTKMNIGPPPTTTRIYYSNCTAATRIVPIICSTIIL